VKSERLVHPKLRFSTYWQIAILLLTLPIWLVGCLANPDSVPTVTPLPSPTYTATIAPPTQTPDAFSVPTHTKEALGMVAYSPLAVGKSSLPLEVDLSRPIISGLGVVYAVSAVEDGSRLIVLTQGKTALYQLIQVDLNNNRAEPLSELPDLQSGVSQYGMLYLPGIDREYVLLSACNAQLCALWRVDIHSGQLLPLATVPQGTRLQYVRGGDNQQRIGVLAQLPLSADGLPLQYFPYNFAERNVPEQFDQQFSLIVQSESSFANLELYQAGGSVRVLGITANGLIFYGNSLLPTDQPIVMTQWEPAKVGMGTPAPASPQLWLSWLANTQSLYPDFSETAMLTMEKLSDSCNNSQQRRGESVQINKLGTQIEFIRVANNRSNVGTFLPELGTFEVAGADRDLSEMFSGALTLDGTVRGNYTYQFKDCKSTYDFTGKLEKNPLPNLPPVLGIFQQGADSLVGEYFPVGGQFSPWLKLAGSLPSSYSVNQLSAGGRLFVIWQAENIFVYPLP